MIFMGAFFPLHFVGTPYPQSDIQNELWERTMSLSINTCYKYIESNLQNYTQINLIMIDNPQYLDPVVWLTPQFLFYNGYLH